MMPSTIMLEDGLAVHKGTPEYDYWQRELLKHGGSIHAALQGRSNPAKIDPKHPHAPKSHPLTAAEKKVKHPANLNGQIVRLCHESLLAAGKMTYTEDYKLRQMLFGRPEGHFIGSDADCSQLGASILHWLGNKKVNSTDYTGTLWIKGKVLGKPVAGCGVIWGKYPGQHFAFFVGNGMTIGFGHQGAPDRNTLAGMNQYFEQEGHPGVRFLEFAA